MKVVVAGAGAVGRHLSGDLAERGHQVVLIEQDPEALEKASDWAEKVTMVLGDACEVWVLKEAGLDTADVMAAVTGDDEDNLVVSFLAKQEFGVPRVLARVNNPRNEWMFDERWGVDVAVSPPHLLTSMVEEEVSTAGDLIRLLPLEGGRVAVVEVRIPEGTTYVGKALFDLRLPVDSAIIAIVRENHVLIPQPETVLAAGDEVMALSSPQSEAQLREAILGG
jgi:trk system potassium uptake protein TrkA